LRGGCRRCPWPDRSSRSPCAEGCGGERHLKMIPPRPILVQELNLAAEGVRGDVRADLDEAALRPTFRRFADLLKVDRRWASAPTSTIASTGCSRGARGRRRTGRSAFRIPAAMGCRTGAATRRFEGCLRCDVGSESLARAHSDSGSRSARRGRSRESGRPAPRSRAVSRPASGHLLRIPLVARGGRLMRTFSAARELRPLPGARPPARRWQH